MRYSPMLAFAATALAAPFTGPSLCPTGLFSNPQCCATDVLGVVGLNCAVPPTAPSDVNNFISICATRGQQAKCCVIPVAGQDVLCQDVSPGGPKPSSSGGSSPSSSAAWSSSGVHTYTPTPIWGPSPSSTSEAEPSKYTPYPTKASSSKASPPEHTPAPPKASSSSCGY